MVHYGDNMRILWLAASFPGHDTIYRSLKSLNENDINIVRFDPPRAGNKRIPELVNTIINTNRPELIIIVGVGGDCAPTLEELRWLQDFAPLIYICPEASDKTWWSSLVEKYHDAKCVDLIVNLDGNKDWPYSEEGLTKLTPIDLTPWHINKPWLERKYLCGTWSTRSGIREEMLNQLDDIVVWRGNIPVRSNITEEEDNLRSYELYVEFNSDCKSILNIPWRGGDGGVSITQSGGMHVKGRVIEAGLASAVLIEHENAETNQWFIPGEDYITYRDLEDIRDMIGWVEHHPNESQQIAKNLKMKVLQYHSPRVFWNDVFAKIKTLRY